MGSEMCIRDSAWIASSSWIDSSMLRVVSVIFCSEGILVHHAAATLAGHCTPREVINTILMAAVWTFDEPAVGASTGEFRYWLPIGCLLSEAWSGGWFDEAIGEVSHAV